MTWGKWVHNKPKEKSKVPSSPQSVKLKRRNEPKKRKLSARPRLKPPCPTKRSKSCRSSAKLRLRSLRATPFTSRKTSQTRSRSTQKPSNSIPKSSLSTRTWQLSISKWVSMIKSSNYVTKLSKCQKKAAMISRN